MAPAAVAAGLVKWSGFHSLIGIIKYSVVTYLHDEKPQINNQIYCGVKRLISGHHIAILPSPPDLLVISGAATRSYKWCLLLLTNPVIQDVEKLMLSIR